MFRYLPANVANPMAEQQEWTITFEEVEQHGLERWLDELAQELKSQTYQPQPVRRVYIPKSDEKQRPLGIPTDSANCS
jgi:retron-type reverse transcriptase